ncbi:MAG TPA: hydrolase [Desulfomonilaceae bacterium]|nr:hydrolase [Desulfomonilaceae bacterium]
MLSLQNTVLVVVDVQEKLAAAMHEKEALVDSTVRMVSGAKILGVPVIHTEQNPKGLGKTVPRVAELLSDVPPVTKLSFSCCGESHFMEQLTALNRKQVLVLGIESHVCVYQTVADLIRQGYEVQVIADAVSSRTPENKAIGLDRCKVSGASITSTETALFELLQKAEGEAFKQMLKVVK